MPKKYDTQEQEKEQAKEKKEEDEGADEDDYLEEAQKFEMELLAVSSYNNSTVAKEVESTVADNWRVVSRKHKKKNSCKEARYNSPAMVLAYFKKVRKIADLHVRAFEGKEKQEEDNADAAEDPQTLDGLY